MRLLRKLVRLKCLAFQQQIPAGDLAVQSQIPRGVQMPDTPFAGERHTAAVSGSRSGIAAKAESDSGKLSGDAGTAYGLYGFGVSIAGTGNAENADFGTGAWICSGE